MLDIQAESGFDIVCPWISNQQNVTPDKRTLFIELEADLLLVLRDRLCEFFEPFRGIMPSCRASLPSSFNQDISLSQESSSVAESMPLQEEPLESNAEEESEERPAKISKTEHTPMNSLCFINVRRAVELWEDSRMETVSIEDIIASRRSSKSSNEMQEVEAAVHSLRFESSVGDDAGEVEREFNARLTKQDFANFQIQ